ncbi:UNVERIFIED_CONTAM: Mce-associated membrane protein [Streptomyces canus]
MAKTTTRGSGSGPGTRRTMTAAARAAAKRAERGHREPGPAATDEKHPGRPEAPAAGRTVIVEAAEEDGWDDPPEPSPESFGEDPPQEEDAPGPGTATRRGPLRRLNAVLCVLLAAALVAVGMLGWRYREDVRAEQARVQAVTAARQAAPVVLSYDYRHLDRDFAAARARLTGHFRDTYRKTTTTVVGPTARKYHGVVKATVAQPPGGSPAASVVSSSADRAVILLFVNQVTESTQVSGSRVDLNRVRMTLTRTADGWKVSAVDAL